MLHPSGEPETRPPITGSVPLLPHEAVAVVMARVGDRYVPLDDFVREVQTVLDAAFADEAIVEYHERRREEAERDEAAYIDARITRYAACPHLWVRRGVVEGDTFYTEIRCERCGAFQDDAA